MQQKAGAAPGASTLPAQLGSQEEPQKGKEPEKANNNRWAQL